MVLASAIFQVFGSFTILALLLAGIGNVLRAAVGLRIQSAADLFLSVWVGYGFTLFSLQIWHLFFPVNPIAFGLFAVFGLVGLFLSRRDAWIGLRAIRETGWVGLLFVGLFLIYAVLLSDVSVGPIRNADTGIYHYMAVRWMATYSIVPGLANLNSRLGYNSSSLLFPTLLDAGFWPRSAQHVSTGVLFFSLAAQWAAAAYRVLTSKSPKSSDVFTVFVQGYGLQHSYYDATGFSTDMPVFALASVIYTQVFRVIAGELEEPREKAFVTAAAIFLSGVAICAKLSTCVLCGGAVLVLLWSAWRDGIVGAFEKRMLGIASCASILSVITWSVRGAILSGYPFFPLTVGALPVDWRAPRATAIVHQHWIACWARRPFGHWSELATGWGWIPEWWRTQIVPFVWDFWIPTAVFILSGVIVGFCLRIRKPGAQRWPLYALLLPHAASLTFWFLTAPGLRLGAGNLWLLSATTASLAVLNLVQSGRFRLSKLFCACGFVMALAAGGAVNWVVVGPGPDNGFYSPPKIQFFRLKTDNGLDVLIPNNPADPSSWDAPLPTTPNPHPNLALRRPGDLSSGFKVKPFDESIVIGMPP